MNELFHPLLDGKVAHNRLTLAAHHGGEGGGPVIEVDSGCAGQIFLRPFLGGGARLDSDFYASGIERIGIGVARVLSDGDALVGIHVGVGEVDLFLARVVDGDVACRDVGLHGLLGHRDDVVELLGGQVVELKAHLLGDHIHELHSKALVVARVVHVLERRGSEVTCDGELAVLDKFVAASLRGSA